MPLKDFEDWKANRPEQNTNIFSDSIDMLQAGAIDTAAGVANFVGAESLSDSLNDWSQSQYDTLSPEGQSAMSKSLINEDLSLGEGATDPRTWWLNSMNVLGGMAATMLPAGAAGKVASVAGNASKVASVAANAGKVSQGVSIGVNGLLNGAAGNGIAARGVEEDINNLDFDDLKDSPQFKELAQGYLSQGASQIEALDQARTELARTAGENLSSDFSLFALNSLVDTVGDRAFGQLVRGSLGKTVKSALAKGIASEGGTEAVQGYGETVLTNQAREEQTNEGRDLTTGAAANALTGAALGAVIGGVPAAGGAKIGQARRRNFESQIEKQITPEVITTMKSQGFADRDIQRILKENTSNHAINLGFEPDEAANLAQQAVDFAYGNIPPAEQRHAQEDAAAPEQPNEQPQQPTQAQPQDDAPLTWSEENGFPNPAEFGLSEQDAELIIDPPADLLRADGTINPQAPKELKQAYQLAMGRAEAQQYQNAVFDNSAPQREQSQALWDAEAQRNLDWQQQQQNPETLQQDQTALAESLRAGDLGFVDEEARQDAQFREGLRVAMESSPAAVLQVAQMRRDGQMSQSQALSALQRIINSTNRYEDQLDASPEELALREASNQQRAQQDFANMGNEQRRQEIQRRLLQGQRQQSQTNSAQGPASQNGERDVSPFATGIENQRVYDAPQVEFDRWSEVQAGDQDIDQRDFNSPYSVSNETKLVNQDTVHQPRQRTERQPSPELTAQEQIDQYRGQRSGVLQGNLSGENPKQNARQAKKTAKTRSAAKSEIFGRVMGQAKENAPTEASTEYKPNTAFADAFAKALPEEAKEPEQTGFKVNADTQKSINKGAVLNEIAQTLGVMAQGTHYAQALGMLPDANKDSIAQAVYGKNWDELTDADLDPIGIEKMWNTTVDSLAEAEAKQAKRQAHRAKREAPQEKTPSIMIEGEQYPVENLEDAASKLRSYVLREKLLPQDVGNTFAVFNDEGDLIGKVDYNGNTYKPATKNPVLAVSSDWEQTNKPVEPEKPKSEPKPKAPAAKVGDDLADNISLEKLGKDRWKVQFDGSEEYWTVQINRANKLINLMRGDKVDRDTVQINYGRSNSGEKSLFAKQYSFRLLNDAISQANRVINNHQESITRYNEQNDKWSESGENYKQLASWWLGLSKNERGDLLDENKLYQSPTKVGRAMRRMAISSEGEFSSIPKSVYEKLEQLRSKANLPAAQDQLTVRFNDSEYPVESLEDAKAKWDQFINATGAGASEVGSGVGVYDSKGDLVGRITYNGRMWTPITKNPDLFETSSKSWKPYGESKALSESDKALVKQELSDAKAAWRATSEGDQLTLSRIDARIKRLNKIQDGKGDSDDLTWLRDEGEIIESGATPPEKAEVVNQPIAKERFAKAKTGKSDNPRMQAWLDTLEQDELDQINSNADYMSFITQRKADFLKANNLAQGKDFTKAEQDQFDKFIRAYADRNLSDRVAGGENGAVIEGKVLTGQVAEEIAYTKGIAQPNIDKTALQAIAGDWFNTTKRSRFFGTLPAFTNRKNNPNNYREQVKQNQSVTEATIFDALSEIQAQSRKDATSAYQFISDAVASGTADNNEQYNSEVKKLGKALDNYGVDNKTRSQIVKDLDNKHTSSNQAALRKVAEIIGVNPDKNPEPPKPTKKNAPAKEAPKSDKPKQQGLSDFSSAVKAINPALKGELSFEEFGALVQNVQDSEEAIRASIYESPIVKRKRKQDVKDSLVNQNFNRLVYGLAQAISSSYGSYEGFDVFNRRPMIEQLRERFEGMTKEQFDSNVESRKQQRAKSEADETARQEGMKNPETRADFMRIAHSKGVDLNNIATILDDDQLAQFDKLQVKEFGERQEAAFQREIERRGTVQAVEGTESTGHETELSTFDDGSPSYVVRLTDRIGKEKWKELAQAARRIDRGVKVANARYAKQAGKPEGWHFTSQDAQNQFVSLLGGETVNATENVTAQAEAKATSARERQTTKLRTLAESQETKANDVLNQSRKTNTAKRAADAARVMDRAYGQQENARTLAAIADAVESGEITMLGNLQDLTQLEELDSLTRRLLWNMDEASREKFAERDNMGRWHLKESTTINDIVRFAKFPDPEMHVNNLRSLAREMATVKGYLNTGKFIAKQVENHGDDNLITMTGPVWNKHIAKIRAFSKIQRYGAADRANELFKTEGRLNRMGIVDNATLREALRELDQVKSGVSTSKPKETPVTRLTDAIAQKVRASKKAYIDFFPTDNSELADSVIDKADIQEGMKVLEPSAGMGDLADRLAAKGADLDVGDISSDMRELLDAKGHNVVADDFLEYKSEPIYDRIVMNPPFNNDSAIDHINHALSMLKDGGRLVAITPINTGDKANSKNKNFREYLEAIGAVEDVNPEGSFKNSLNPTMVNTKTIVIDKPESSADLPVPDDIRFSQTSIVGDNLNFAQDIEKLSTTRISRPNPVVVMDTPDVLQAVGMPVKKIYISKDVLVKSTRSKHAVSLDVIKNLPNLLRDPDAVFRPKNESVANAGGKNVVVEAVDANGQPIMVAIHVDRNLGKITDINVVASVHGRQSADYNNWVKLGLLEYVKSKTPNWLDRSELQLPLSSNEARSSRRSLVSQADNVKTKADIVKKMTTKQSIKPRRALDEANKFIAQYEGLKGINISVVQTQDQLSEFASTQPNVKVKGVWLSSDNRVVLVAENITNPADLRSVLRHELIAHNGLYANLNEAEIDALTQKVNALRNNRTVKPIFAEVDKAYKNAPDHVKAEEVIARLAEEESGAIRKLADRVLAFVMGALRRSGVLAQDKVSLYEVRTMINNTERSLRDGKGKLRSPDVVRYSQTVTAEDFEKMDLGDPKMDYAAAVEQQADSFYKRMLTKGKEFTKGSALYDAAKGNGWGLLTMRQIVEVGKAKVSTEYGNLLEQYQTLVNKKMARQNQLLGDVTDISEDLRQWIKSGNKEQADELFNFMHEATIANVDPSREYQDLTDLLTDMIAIKEEQIRGRSGDAKKKLFDELKQYKQDLKGEAYRRKAHAKMKVIYDKMTPEQQKYFSQVRDHYEKQQDQMFTALVDRAAKLSLSGKGALSSKQALNIHNRLIKEFGKTHAAELGQLSSSEIGLELAIAKKGYYVPLARFGKYWVSTKWESGKKPTGEVILDSQFEMFESEEEMKGRVNQLKAAGFNPTFGMNIDESGMVSGATMGFVTDMMDKINTTNMTNDAKDQLKDDLYQMFLQALPDRSLRKSFIHRKGTRGYSDNALRALADQGFKQSRQQARLETEDDLNAILTGINDKAKAETNNISAQRIANEMNHRHEWVMNPKRAKWAQKLTGIGFFMLIGASPASALMNLTQNIQVAIPVIGAKYGYAATAAEMGSLTKAWVTNRYAASKDQKTKNKFGVLGSILEGEEREAMRRAVEQGTIDVTQTSDALQLAEEPDAQYGDWKDRVNRALGWSFHNAEVLNREVTFMTAYRLARRNGMGSEAAFQYANKATWDSHFDYGSLNRARFMQGDVATVALQFKQYSQNMTYYLMSNTMKALGKGNPTPEQRKEAAKQILGTMALTFAMGGLSAMPLATVASLADMAMGIAEGLGVADENEPWDAETELRGILTEWFGSEWANTLYNGLPPEVGLPAIGNRINIDFLRMWVRESDAENASGTVSDLGEQFFGPIGGIVTNAARGVDYAVTGRTYRAAEMFMPKWVKDIIKVGRYASEGGNVTNRNGEVMIADLTPIEYAGQFLGFTPTRLSHQYDINGQIKKYEAKVMRRRQLLLSQMWVSYMKKDQDEIKQIWKAIKAYNRSSWGKLNPISGDTVKTSVRQHLKMQGKAVNGLHFNHRFDYEIRKSFIQQ